MAWNKELQCYDIETRDPDRGFVDPPKDRPPLVPIERNADENGQQYYVAVGTYSTGEQVVSIMDNQGRARSLTPDDAEFMASALNEAAAIVRGGRGTERARRWGPRRYEDGE